jgi:hypothetical protein
LSTKLFKTFIITSPEGRTARTEVRQQLKKRLGQTCQYNTGYYINKFLFESSLILVLACDNKSFEEFCTQTEEKKTSNQNTFSSIYNVWSKRNIDI